jgi:hypothetical protein
MRRSRKRNSHVKSDKYVEVSCPSSASYKELCDICADALDVDLEEDDAYMHAYMHELMLFRIDGTVVPNKPIGDRHLVSI